MHACMQRTGKGEAEGREPTSPDAPCTISPASMGPLSEDPSPLRGMLIEIGIGVCEL